MDPFWILVPSDRDFTKSASWKSVGKNRFVALALFVVGQPRRGTQLLKGASISKFEVLSGTKVNLVQELARIVTYTDVVERQVQETVAAKLGATLSTKAGGEVGFTALVPSGKLSNEISATAAAEISAQLQEQLKTTQSYQVQESDKVTLATEVVLGQGPSQPESMFLYLNVRPLHWDLYIAAVEEVEVEYGRSLPLFKMHRKFNRQDYVRVDTPLCRLTFYEPVKQYSLARGAHAPEVEDPYSILIDTVPPSASAPRQKPPLRLKDFGMRAFPISADRASEVARRRGRPPGTPGSETRANKRASSRKSTTAVRKSGQLKSVKRSSSKKTPDRRSR